MIPNVNQSKIVFNASAQSLKIDKDNKASSLFQNSNNSSAPNQSPAFGVSSNKEIGLFKVPEPKEQLYGKDPTIDSDPSIKKPIPKKKDIKEFDHTETRTDPAQGLYETLNKEGNSKFGLFGIPQ